MAHFSVYTPPTPYDFRGNNLNNAVDESGYLKKDYPVVPLPKADYIQQGRFTNHVTNFTLRLAGKSGKRYRKDFPVGKFINELMAKLNVKNGYVKGSLAYFIGGHGLATFVTESLKLNPIKFNPKRPKDSDVDLDVSHLTIEEFNNLEKLILDVLQPHLPTVSRLNILEDILLHHHPEPGEAYSITIGTQGRMTFDIVLNFKQKRDHLFIRDDFRYCFTDQHFKSSQPNPIQAPLDYFRGIIHADNIETINESGWIVAHNLQAKGLFLADKGLNGELAKKIKKENLTYLVTKGALKRGSVADFVLDCIDDFEQNFKPEEWQHLWQLEPDTNHPIRRAIVEYKIPYQTVRAYIQRINGGIPDFKLLANRDHLRVLDYIFQTQGTYNAIVADIIHNRLSRDLWPLFNTKENATHFFNHIVAVDSLWAYRLMKEHALPYQVLVLQAFVREKRAREALELYFAMPDSGDFTEAVFNLVKEIEGPNSAVENYFRMNRSSRMDFVCLDVLTPVQLIQHSATLVQRIPEALKIKLKPYLDQLGPKQAIGLTNSLPPELKKEFVKAQLQQQITTPKKEEYRALLMTLDPSTEYEVELLNLFKSVKEKLGLKEAIALLANSAMAALNKDSLSDILFNRFNPDTEDLFWEMIKLAAANCPAKIPSLLLFAENKNYTRPPQITIAPSVIQFSERPLALAEILSKWEVPAISILPLLGKHKLPSIELVRRGWIGTDPLTSAETSLLMNDPLYEEIYPYIESRIPSDFDRAPLVDRAVADKRFSFAIRIASPEQGKKIASQLRGQSALLSERLEMLKKSPSYEEWLALISEITYPHPLCDVILSHFLEKGLSPLKPAEKDDILEQLCQWPSPIWITYLSHFQELSIENIPRVYSLLLELGKKVGVERAHLQRMVLSLANSNEGVKNYFPLLIEWGHHNYIIQQLDARDLLDHQDDLKTHAAYQSKVAAYCQTSLSLADFTKLHDKLNNAQVSLFLRAEFNRVTQSPVRSTWTALLGQIDNKDAYLNEIRDLFNAVKKQGLNEARILLTCVSTVAILSELIEEAFKDLTLEPRSLFWECVGFCLENHKREASRLLVLSNGQTSGMPKRLVPVIHQEGSKLVEYATDPFELAEILIDFGAPSQNLLHHLEKYPLRPRLFKMGWMGSETLSDKESLYLCGHEKFDEVYPHISKRLAPQTDLACACKRAIDAGNLRFAFQLPPSVHDALLLEKARGKKEYFTNRFDRLQKIGSSEEWPHFINELDSSSKFSDQVFKYIQANRPEYLDSFLNKEAAFWKTRYETPLSQASLVRLLKISLDNSFEFSICKNIRGRIQGNLASELESIYLEREFICNETISIELFQKIKLSAPVQAHIKKVVSDQSPEVKSELLKWAKTNLSRDEAFYYEALLDPIQAGKRVNEVRIDLEVFEALFLTLLKINTEESVGLAKTVFTNLDEKRKKTHHTQLLVCLSPFYTNYAYVSAQLNTLDIHDRSSEFKIGCHLIQHLVTNFDELQKRFFSFHSDLFRTLVIRSHIRVAIPGFEPNQIPDRLKSLEQTPEVRSVTFLRGHDQNNISKEERFEMIHYYRYYIELMRRMLETCPTDEITLKYDLIYQQIFALISAHPFLSADFIQCYTKFVLHLKPSDYIQWKKHLENCHHLLSRGLTCQFFLHNPKVFVQMRIWVEGHLGGLNQITDLNRSYFVLYLEAFQNYTKKLTAGEQLELMHDAVRKNLNGCSIPGYFRFFYTLDNIQLFLIQVKDSTPLIRDLYLEAFNRLDQFAFETIRKDLAFNGEPAYQYIMKIFPSRTKCAKPFTELNEQIVPVFLDKLLEAYKQNKKERPEFFNIVHGFLSRALEDYDFDTCYPVYVNMVTKFLDFSIEQIKLPAIEICIMVADLLLRTPQDMRLTFEENQNRAKALMHILHILRFEHHMHGQMVIRWEMKDLRAKDILAKAGLYDQFAALIK